MRKAKRLGICFAIALLLASITISPNFFREKPQEERVEAFAPALPALPMVGSALGGLALGPVAIGLGIAVAAVAVGVGVGSYIKNANSINAEVLHLFNTASGKTKKMWLGAAQEFIKKANAGEKVIDSAGNLIMDVPKELGNFIASNVSAPSASKTKAVTGGSGYISAKTANSFMDMFKHAEFGSEGIGLRLYKTDYVIEYFVTNVLGERVVSLTYGLSEGKYEDELYVVQPSYSETRITVGNRWHDNEYSMWQRGLSLKEDISKYAASNLLVEKYKYLYVNLSALTVSQFQKIISDIESIKDYRIVHIPAGPDKKARYEAFTGITDSNYKTAKDNARDILTGGKVAVPAPLCRLPRAYATGANGQLQGDITWNGSINNGAGAWTNGENILDRKALDQLGSFDLNIPTLSGKDTLTPDLTWTIPNVDDWADTPVGSLGNTAVKTPAGTRTADFVNEGLGTNVIDDAKPISDSVALNPPVTLPKVPPGAVAPPVSGDRIHWEKLTDLGKNFTRVFPFCIPFDVGDFVAGSVNTLERKEFEKYEVPIYKSYKVTLAIPEEFYPIGDIIRTILLVLYDVGLMYAVYKWFSALK